MPIGIEVHGIVQRWAENHLTIHLASRTGAPGNEIEIPDSIANIYRLDTGDIVEGDIANGCLESINDLQLDEAAERPQPRTKRSSYERIAPNRLIPLSSGPTDLTGRILDLAAPFGLGCAGIIFGPHGSGLSRTLRAVVEGIDRQAPDVRNIVLLIRSRGEEVTEWRRRFKDADIVVCPSGAQGATPDNALHAAQLVLECAQRQTELGRHVVLAIDSLTGLWGAMLETEEADAQAEADVAHARIGIAEWMSRAGDFTGEGLFGSGLGGSLTIVGTAWHQEVDRDEEEDRESHPHLRLLEHVLHETNWRVALSGELTQQRMFPAIDTIRCLSQYDRTLLNEATYDSYAEIRSRLARLEPLERWRTITDAIGCTASNDEVLEYLPEIASHSNSLI